MRGAVMTRETASRFDNLNKNATLKVIEDADNGIDLSEPFDSVDDLMVALDA